MIRCVQKPLERMKQLASWHRSTLRVVSVPMSALARTSERDCRTRTTNENCTASESWTRTKYDYDAFGNLLHSTGTMLNNYLFAGEQYDPDLGLYYNRARYLNTSTGRFWTMDAYEGVANDPPPLHKYLYSLTDSVDRIDPSGNDDLIGTIGALALQYPLVTMILISAGLDAVGGCIAGALDSQSTCNQGFYSNLLFGAFLVR